MSDDTTPAQPAYDEGQRPATAARPGSEPLNPPFAKAPTDPVHVMVATSLLTLVALVVVAFVSEGDEGALGSVLAVGSLFFSIGAVGQGVRLGIRAADCDRHLRRYAAEDRRARRLR